ncbi:MAG: deaminase [Candidatus Auribacterota bacterium]|jgi:dCMP deaminase|nr:deaminase [Candidatus Auribacterota bacterium]
MERHQRITKEEMYMRMAIILSARSTCQRIGSDGQVKRVGCVITNSDLSNILSVGYNGNAAGLPDECTDPNMPGNCGCLHAEENAISKCRSHERDKIMFTTDSPCPRCAKFIINNGFSKVYFLREYRDATGLDLLRQVGIETSPIELTKNSILNRMFTDIQGWQP